VRKAIRYNGLALANGANGAFKRCRSGETGASAAHRRAAARPKDLFLHQIVRTRLVCALVLLMTGGAAPVPAAAIRAEGDLFFVDCKVDGAAERCQLDTGENTTATLRRSAAFDRLPVVEAGKTVGVSGVAVASNFVHVARIEVGGIAVEDLDDIQVLTRPHPFSSLGLGFFERLGTVTFDFARGELRRDGPAPGRRCPGAFAVTNVMRVPAALSGQSVSVAWDTGASSTVADIDFVRAHPALFAFVRDLPSGADATSVGVPAQLFKAATISVCGRDFHDVFVVGVDMSAGRARIPDLPDVILGANLMAGHVWAFDFKDRSWSLD
jgi:hypothetical protein